MRPGEQPHYQPRGIADHRVQVAPDLEEAVKWTRLAAEGGDKRAQYNLSYLYLSGEGVPQDSAEAFMWATLAAKQGFAPAQYNLGLMYDTGEGVAEDNTEAVKWYLFAAEQGDAVPAF